MCARVCVFVSMYVCFSVRFIHFIVLVLNKNQGLASGAPFFFVNLPSAMFGPPDAARVTNDAKILTKFTIYTLHRSLICAIWCYLKFSKTVNSLLCGVQYLILKNDFELANSL